MFRLLVFLLVISCAKEHLKTYESKPLNNPIEEKGLAHKSIDIKEVEVVKLLNADDLLLKVSKLYEGGKYEEAIQLGLEGANLKNKDLAFMIAMSYLQIGEPESTFKWMLKAGEWGHAHAAFALHLLYKKGHGTELNYVESYKWLEKAVELEHPEALFQMATIFRKEKNLVKSYEYIAKAADLGFHVAIGSQGVHLVSGQGVEKDVPKGMALLKKVCDMAYSPGCFNLAASYFNEKKDLDMAIKYGEKALELGFVQATPFLEMLKAKKAESK